MAAGKTNPSVCSTPSPRSFIVVNAKGQPMGRMSLCAPFDHVPLQFSACFPLAEATIVADKIGGAVKPAPIFDNLSKEWVFPSFEHHTAQ